MKDALWLFGVLAVVAPGMIVWHVPLVRRMDRGARLAMAFASGILIVTLVLYGYHFLGIRWTRTAVSLPLIAFAIAGWFARGDSARGNRDVFFTTIVSAAFLVTLYAAADARMTCGDFVYFWAPKGVAFYRAHAIDTTFLAYPHYIFMHPDYPPLVTIVYAWGSTVARGFSWWGPLLLAPPIVVCIALIVRGFGAASRHAAMIAAILATTFIISMVGGAGEPFLLLFEAIALSAVTFAPQSRDAQWIAAAALAAAAFTKVEGAAFAVLVAAAFAIVHRRPFRAIAILAPTIALFGSWILFAWRHGLLAEYARAQTKTHWEFLTVALSGLLRQASYRSAYLPWIAAAMPLLFARRLRNAVLPLAVGAGTVACAIFFYLHREKAEYVSIWVDTSAVRVLLTPLLCLAIASAATSDRVAADGLVPQGEEAARDDAREAGHGPGRAVDQV